MSRRHSSKARREARRKRIAARLERAMAPLPPGPPGPPGSERRSFSWVARGGARLDLVLVGPAVPFDPTTHAPADLPLMVVNEMLRQAHPHSDEGSEEN